MKPRNTNAVKQNEIPDDLLKQIATILKKAFKKASEGRDIKVKGVVFDKEILLASTFQEKGALKVISFESSMDLVGKNRDLLKLVDIVFDSMSSMIDQYFKSEGDIDMPKEWTPFVVDGQKVFLRMTTQNEELESKADEILKVNPKTGKKLH